MPSTDASTAFTRCWSSTPKGCGVVLQHEAQKQVCENLISVNTSWRYSFKKRGTTHVAASSGDVDLGG
jgi:hypothetical protein